MHVRRWIVLHCCLWLIALTGCQSNSASSESTASTPSQAVAQTPVGNSSSSSPQLTQNSSNQNAGMPAAATTTTRMASSGKSVDVCSLLTGAEIEAMQGEPVKAAQGSAGNSSRFAVSQCFYSVATAYKSVSLELTQRVANQASADSPKNFLKEQFEQATRKRGTGAGGAVGKKGVAPQKVGGVGDEAYWVGNSITGALYVIKGDSFIRISIGGPDSEAVKIEKLKTLAQSALKRLKD